MYKVYKIDLRQAIKVRDMCTHEKFKIGIVNGNVDGCVNSWNCGDIILYRNVEKNTCTVESPMPDAEIQRQIKQGSALRTWGCCVNFPLKYIDEVII